MGAGLAFKVNLLFAVVILLNKLTIRGVASVSSSARGVLTSGCGSLLCSHQVLSTLRQVGGSPRTHTRFRGGLSLRRGGVARVSRGITATRLITRCRTVRQSLGSAAVRHIEVTLGSVVDLGVTAVCQGDGMTRHATSRTLL